MYLYTTKEKNIKTAIMKKVQFLLALVLCIASASGAWALDVNNLRVMHLTNPSCVDDTPTFSWQLQSDERGTVQTAYQIVVTSDAEGEEVVWDSGRQQSSQSVNVTGNMSLQPSTRYYWHVTVEDNKGHEASSAESAYFDTGLLQSGWDGARWIKASDLKPGEEQKEIKDYTVEGKVRIERTAAGLCFAMQDNANFYFWQLNTEGDYPRLRPHVWKNGNPACLDNVDLRGKVTLNNSDEFTLRIEVTGASRARTYINDVLVDERTGSFDFGKVGMREDHGERDSREEIGVYDDITVKDGEGNVVFSEDFETGNSFTGGTVTGGKLRIVGSTAGHVLVWQKEQNSVHYTLDYDMVLVKASAAVVFAATSSNTYHMWQINCYDGSQPSVRHHIYINGNLSWADHYFSQFTKAELLGHQHHYTIDVHNGVITTSVDGTVVNVYEDNTGTAVLGDIGMRVSPSTGEEAYFDNLVLTVYDNGGNPSVTLSEDFEGESSDYFLSADVEDFMGSRQCHVKAAGGDLRLMQTSTDGVPTFRRAFQIDRPVASARLYTSALGVYDLYVNGKRVGHEGGRYEELKPGWSDYRNRVFYSAHDVTALLQEGDNAIGAIVASGWFAGGIGHGMYGSDNDLALLAKLVISYEDGTDDLLVSDGSWRSSKKQGLRYSDIYNGEIYDARMESDWKAADYDDSDWNSVDFNDTYSGAVESFKGPFVEVLTNDIQTMKTATVFEGSTPKGSDYGMINVVSVSEGEGAVSLKKGQSVIIDFGQNIVGWIRTTVEGNAGSRLHIQYAEMLNDTGQKSRGNDGPGGTLYLANLRSARAETFYTLCGRQGGEEWQSATSFYGFRYCCITPSSDITIHSIEAVPVSSSTEDIGSLSTDNEMVNKLISNILWGQRGNLLSIPTDCPQRDERQGWTADTQVYSKTGMLNSSLEAFYRKWMQDMRDGQRSDGAFPDTAPIGYAGYGGSAWSDAGILVPWYVYSIYGDKEVLAENFAAMEKYMQWMARQTGDGYKYNGALTTYGDWLSYAATDSRYISVAYYAYDAQIMEKVCNALSQSPNDSYARKAKSYATLFQNIKAEFRSRYITPTLKAESQTAYLLALEYNLLEDDEIDTFKRLLTKAIRDNSYKLSTGFVGTAILNCTLSRFGMSDLAYSLLLQRRNPSWLYPIDQGATTMWERWNSYTKESGFGDPGMNSFNHYAYGAVGEWMYRYMAGISFDEEQPGFQHIILQPTPDRRTTIPSGQSRIRYAEGSHQSYYGTVSTAWSTTGDADLDFTCTVPANTTATLLLPVAADDIDVYEGNFPAAEAEGVTYEGFANGMMTFTLGSGSYHFHTDGTSSLPSLTADSNEEDSRVFDLQGRRLTTADAPLSDGIYIRGGKKLAVTHQQIR